MATDAGDTPAVPRVSLRVADVDDYQDVARCPLCGQRVDANPGTPSIPVSAFVDASVALDLDEEVPAFGYRCTRHRETIKLLAPGELAPGNYACVDAEIDGEAVEIAIPSTLLSEVSA